MSPAKASSGSAKASARPAKKRAAARNAGRTLVVGYDRTPSSRAAVEWAAEHVGDGKLVFVYSLRPLHAPPSPLETAEERRAFAGAAIDELMLEGKAAVLDAEIETEISDEDPVTALTDAARRHDAAAIVVGCEQHSRLRKAIGTVTTQLLERSPVPVTAVPSPAEQ